MEAVVMMSGKSCGLGLPVGLLGFRVLVSWVWGLGFRV